SHTVGPMRAACRFARMLEQSGRLGDTASLDVRLYGSLALTGKGHGTDRAVLLGLEGSDPQSIDPDSVAPAMARIGNTGRLRLMGRHEIAFDIRQHLLFLYKETLPRHTNGMRLSAYSADGTQLAARNYYSIGGGFIVEGDEETAPENPAIAPPYPFCSGADLLEQCAQHNLRIFDLVMANETSRRPEAEVRAGLLRIWQVMEAAINRGFRQTEPLPGTLGIARRARALFRRLEGTGDNSGLQAIDWVNAWAMAVSEENAAGGRIVTAPTNGAAGIIPAVIQYYLRFETGADLDGVVRFLAVAAAIGMLYKRNASISGAEMGCQGEVGVSCSMAAAGLAAAMGASNAQIENAAEIGMEHNLGLTCDPVGGLVQIPCIERNAMGAVKAINAARLALCGNGSHKVSLDQVIITMYQTGRDMATKYKETSQGGLALNVPEC
ncbi:MAG: L-serine ammonia-lyase, partial [Rhizomicrobium sp.]